MGLFFFLVVCFFKNSFFLSFAFLSIIGYGGHLFELILFELFSLMDRCICLFPQFGKLSAIIASRDCASLPACLPRCGSY